MESFVASSPYLDALGPTRYPDDVLARFVVSLYCFVHGRLRLPGAGWLLRRVARRDRTLQNYPLKLQNAGTAIVDFRDDAAFGLLNFSLGEFGQHSALVTLLSNHLKPGDVLWDVGANVGYLAQHFARASFGLAAIHAFEPNPFPLKTLQSLFRDHPRVTVHPVGLGAACEQRQIQVHPHASAFGSIIRELPGAVTIAISIHRADDYCTANRVAPPNLVKIDVEGFEPQVLAGMQKTIRENRPIIIFEHLWLDDGTVRELVPFDYELLFLLDDGTLTPDFLVGRRGTDALLVPREKSRYFL